MMRRLLYVACIATLAICSTVSAHQNVYIFNIDGPTEVPPNASLGTGFAKVTIDFDLLMMRVEAEFEGLTGNTTAAHIHCCDFLPDGRAGVATQTPSFTGFPLGVTAGTMDEIFDMTLPGSYRGQFITDNGGTVSGAFNALVAGLDSGMAYFNIHTNTSPGGEIRGLAQLVPEPASALLALVGLGMPLLLRRSR